MRYKICKGIPVRSISTPHTVRNTFVRFFSVLVISSNVFLDTAFSQANFGLQVTNGNKPRDVILRITNERDACGIAILFGDGRESKQRLESGSTINIEHNYRQDGEYKIKIEGASVIRGLKSVGPCQGSETVTAVVSDTNVNTLISALGQEKPNNIPNTSMQQGVDHSATASTQSTDAPLQKACSQFLAIGTPMERVCGQSLKRLNDTNFIKKAFDVPTGWLSESGARAKKAVASGDIEGARDILVAQFSGDKSLREALQEATSDHAQRLRREKGWCHAAESTCKLLIDYALLATIETRAFLSEKLAKKEKIDFENDISLRAAIRSVNAGVPVGYFNWGAVAAIKASQNGELCSGKGMKTAHDWILKAANRYHFGALKFSLEGRLQGSSCYEKDLEAVRDIGEKIANSWPKDLKKEFDDDGWSAEWYGKRLSPAFARQNEELRAAELARQENVKRVLGLHKSWRVIALCNSPHRNGVGYISAEEIVTRSIALEYVERAYPTCKLMSTPMPRELDFSRLVATDNDRLLYLSESDRYSAAVAVMIPRN